MQERKRPRSATAATTIRVHSCQFVVRPGRMVLFALVVSVLASVQGAELLNADLETLKTHADRHLELHGKRAVVRRNMYIGGISQSELFTKHGRSEFIKELDRRPPRSKCRLF